MKDIKGISPYFPDSDSFECIKILPLWTHDLAHSLPVLDDIQARLWGLTLGISNGYKVRVSKTDVLLTLLHVSGIV